MRNGKEYSFMNRIDLEGNNKTYLRVSYDEDENNPAITDINFFRISCKDNKQSRLVSSQFLLDLR